MPPGRSLVPILAALVGHLPAQHDLAGRWEALPEFAGTRGTVVLEIDDQGQAQLSLPDIDARGFRLGPVRERDGQVQVGQLMQLERHGEHLRGVLPPALVPVYEIEVEFARRDDDSAPGPEEEALVRGTEVWAFDAGSAVWAGIARWNTDALVVTAEGRVLALSTEDGTVRWQTVLEAGSRARPTIADDTALIHTDDGRLHRLAMTDGAARWQVTLTGDASAQRSRHYELFASGATVHGDAAFVGDRDGTLHAIDLDSGESLWKYATGDLIPTTPAVTGDRVVIGSFDHAVHCVNATTGELLWKHDTGAPATSSPVICGDLVVAGSRSYDLLGLRLDDGSVAWRRYLWFSWVESSPTERNGTVFVGSSDAQQLFAIDAATGDQRWQFDTGGSAWGQPAVSDDTVFIGAVGVREYMVPHEAAFHAVDRATGIPRWSVIPANSPDTKWGFAAAPVVVGDLVIAATLAGRVSAFRAPE